MSEFIEQSMRTLKLGGMAREWRSVQYENTEQYITDLLRLELREREANRINRMVKTAGFRVMKTLDDFIWNNAILYDGAFFELVFDGGPEEIRQWCARLQPSAPPFDDLMYMVYDGPFCGVQEYQNCHLRCMYTLKNSFYARENTLAQARPSEAKYLPAAYSEEWMRQLELKCGDGQAVKAYLSREVLPVLLQNRPDPEYVREMLERWLRRFELIFDKKPLFAWREEIRLAVHVWDAISIFSKALDELLPERGEISYALQSALNYMRANLGNPALRLQDVAAYVAVSPGYLSRRFKEEMGVSYQEMLTRVRMERAVTLLRTGGSRVYQVAEQCGYSSYRSFENAFSNFYGQSPKVFK